MLLAHGVEVVYARRNQSNPSVETTPGVRSVALPELLRSSDCVSIHAKYDPGSAPIIGRSELDLMKPTAFLVNTARGRLVDEAALASALSTGRLAGAGLDVFWEEPLPTDSPLLGLDNVVLTPHVAGIPDPTPFELANVARLIRGHADA
jgi:phosphoglycerate dehydrogenase-like enzyme